MPRRHIASIVASTPHDGALIRTERLYNDLRRVPSVGTDCLRGREQDGLVTWKNLWAGQRLAFLRPDDDLRFAAVRRHLHDPFGLDPGEHVAIVPTHVDAEESRG